MEPIDTLRIHHEEFSKEGMWNWDEHTYGLYCGMELAMATVEGREPTY